MAVTQSTLVNESTTQETECEQSENKILFEQSIDILGCPVDGCNYSGDSIHALYSHSNYNHHGNSGEEGLKQQMLVQYFNQFSKEHREQSVTLTAEY